ncbi:MAG: hypothetical protein IJ778_01410 [Alphaproteobacteria bacterium]|nr:hypothetical protein [Alphaproteobacteria bacterium]
MKSENIKLMLLTAIFTTFSFITQAQSLSARQIYSYAKNGNIDALKNLGNTINSKDENGNTALCLALNEGNGNAYRILQKYGADITVKCNVAYGLSAGDNPYYGYYPQRGYYPRPKSSGTFLGMGPVGWTVTGVVVAAGAGVAIAAGGGGGGGGSSSGSGKKDDDKKPEDDSATKDLDNEPITDKDEGHEISGKIIEENYPESKEDYLKNSNNGTIKKIVKSQSAVLGISSESVSTFNALSFGGNATSDIIIAQRGSGDVYGIKGPQNDIDDVTDDDDGINIHNAVFADFDDEEKVTGNVTGNITIRNTGAGTGDIYGMQVKGQAPNNTSDAVNALVESKSSSASATGNILIENVNSNKNIYGIYSVGEAKNAETDENAKASGNITIHNKGNGNVHGIQALREDIANADATEKGESKARIDINNTGNGNVYGINAYGLSLYNAYAGHERREEKDKDDARATATINIENKGTGNVYGLKSSSDIYNAFSYYNSIATGKIRVSNNGKGDAYGIYGNSLIKNASAHSYNSNYHATAKGYVNIINKSSGNAYGIYSKNPDNMVMNNSEDDGEIQQSVIELANTDDGLVVGIYSKDGTIENSGDIKIHNLADGVAVGIYADGATTVESSGNIIINRESYKDDMATDKTSDDVTYKAKSAKGGKAIGIYGSSGSNITNMTDGIIRINGASTAYGIYTEGGNVTNNGKIYIDDVLKTDQCMGSGCLSENHAIVLNGGKLFQDGVLYAEGTWYDPCQSVTCGANATCSVVGNSGVCQCNAGYEGNANTGCTLVTAENDEDVFGKETTKTIGRKIEGKDEYDGDGTPINYAYNNSDVKLNTNSADTVIGLRIFSEESANAGKADTHAASVNVKQQGNGKVYGVRSEYTDGFDGWVYNALAEADTEISQTQNAKAVSTGLINVLNIGNGDMYGMSATQLTNACADAYIEESGQTADATATGRIHLVNNKSSSGNMYGMYGSEIMENAEAWSDEGTTAKAIGLISLVNKGTGYAYGMYARKTSTNVYNRSNKNTTSTIEIANVGSGMAVGMYAKDGKIDNSGTVKIHNLAGGTVVGIYADGNTIVTNSGKITIDRSDYRDDKATEDTSDDYAHIAETSRGGTAIGIYGAAGSTITNTSDGKIYINGADTAYGIYTEGSESSVINNGTILIDGMSGENAVRTNGGTLFQNGKLYVANNAQSSSSFAEPISLNLNDFGGTVVASNTSQFVVEGAISGDLAINNNVVENGFDTTYSVKDMIQASDTDGLNLQSQSVLFDAKLENNTDAVMTMKAFNDVVENNSVADFLQNNYASSNNEDLFKALKSAENVAELNSNIDDLLGKNMLSHMAFEDLSMLREVSLNMNNHLFEKEGSFAFGENISPSGYDNKFGSISRYSLNGFNNGKTSFGLGVSITDIHTVESKKDNRRYDRNFMMSMPVGHKTHGFELISTPKLGYAHGTYKRKGFNDMVYDGKIQRRTFALMNEARYPLNFKGVRLFPSTEFNMIGYNIKGHEDSQQYALRMKSQNHYSVEAGLGLMAQKEFKPYKGHKFNVNGGVAVYHEFSNPYELEVGMSDMDGYYKLQDEKRGENRTVVRFGFDYSLKDKMNVSANLMTNIDHEYRSGANIDLKYNF